MHFIENERILLDNRIKHPDQFIVKITKAEPSSLNWRKSKTELAEILLALDLDHSICKSNGAKADFTEVVRVFQWLLNINLGEPYDLKRAVATRKTKLTVYLDRLKELLKECHLKM